VLLLLLLAVDASSPAPSAMRRRRSGVVVVVVDLAAFPMHDDDEITDTRAAVPPAELGAREKGEGTVEVKAVTPKAGAADAH